MSDVGLQSEEYEVLLVLLCSLEGKEFGARVWCVCVCGVCVCYVVCVCVCVWCVCEGEWLGIDVCWGKIGG